MSCSYRNITQATVAGLSHLLRYGNEIEVRGSQVRELRNHFTVLQRPQERCLFIPHRNNDPVATVAETLWVFAGRDDINWLGYYLPRAAEFSDDGRTWRGAYGPRLRNWHGVDQLAECLRILKSDSNSRRAVMSLYDPARDFSESKDIPCNNWLDWLQRDGRLHLTIGVRSNDVIWGFSGINSFEWSVLQQMMSFWLGVEPGDATYLATSFHVYERHYERSRLMLEVGRETTCYDYGLHPPAFTIPFEELDSALLEWFGLEEQLRSDPEKTISSPRIQKDPFLAVSLELMRLHQGIGRGWSEDRIRHILRAMPSCDLTAAAYVWSSRRLPGVLEDIPDGRIAAFVGEYTRDVKPGNSTSIEPTIPERIKRLHAQKDAAYGKAWKKRGELTSILANIARKVDRLEQYVLTQASLSDESLTDTAIDLFVYLLKYRLFLHEQLSNNGAKELDASASLPSLSDQLSAFDALIDLYDPSLNSTNDILTAIEKILQAFEVLHASAASGAPISNRLEANEYLSAHAWTLILMLERSSGGAPQTVLSGTVTP